METKVAVFKGKQVRKILFKNEWYFSIIDIIEVLTDSEKPRDYWYRMKQREKEASGIELSTFCRRLKLESTDGKKYLERKTRKKVVTPENYLEISQKEKKRLPKSKKYLNE